MTDIVGHVPTAASNANASYLSILSGALNGYEALQSSEVNGFVNSLFTSSNAFRTAEAAESAAREVIRTIEVSDEAYDSLKAHLAQGHNRASWLQSRLVDTEATTPGLDAGSLAVGLQQGLAMSEAGLQPTVLVDLQEPSGRAVLKGLADDIQNTTLLGAISFGQGDVVGLDTNHGEVRVLERYFRDRLESPEDAPLRKVVAAATVIATDKGFLPPLAGKTPTEITMITDRGLMYAKVAFKVASGNLKLTDALDYMIDRTAAAVGAAVTRAAETFGASAGIKLGAMVGGLLGPAGAVAGAVIGRSVGALAGKAVGALVSKGIQVVADKAKSLVRGVVDAAGSFVSSAASRVASFFRF